MRKIISSFAFLFSIVGISFGQASHSFPQNEVNRILQDGIKKKETIHANSNIPTEINHLNPILHEMEEVKKNSQAPYRVHNNLPQTQTVDTLIVGAVPNDTLVITGTWNHTGPIWVYGTGVLIFKNALVHDTGDVYVWGNGKWIADSSSFFFPQNYFYERSFLILQNALAHFGNCSLNYSGMSHSLVVADNGIVDWQDVHQNDWTTCGLYGQPTVNINHCNVSGEYIITDSCTLNLNHADTIILWHQFPSSALINFSFPNTNPVYNYDFNHTISGVSGINYHIHADSCANVSWAIMPVNGSDVTISNSVLRLIGAWFQHGDTTSAYGIFNNSSYSNFTTPLPDRNLHLINTSVQTWSFYVFDSSVLSIDSCQLGEIGTQQYAMVIANNTLADGSGGYFWATDSSFTSATNCISYNTCRSEKRGMFVLAYSWLPFVAPTAIHNSNLICVQNNLVADPIPYDGSVAWLSKMDGPDTSSVNAIVPLTGSEWINQGPLGNPVDFSSYSLYFQNPSISTNWYPIVVDSTLEISHGILGDWQTSNLTPGTYILKSVLKDNFNDSVEGLKLIVLLENPLSTPDLTEDNSVTVTPNPFNQFAIIHSSTVLNNAQVALYNSVGMKIRSISNVNGNEVEIQKGELTDGIYFIELVQDGNLLARRKLLIAQ